jgi:Transposase DDE domain
MTKVFRPYSLDQRLLLPPDLREWLPEGHLALFISDVIEELDLSAIVTAYEGGDGRGQPPYHPQMQEKLATPAGRVIYALRKTIVEPVFGQIKEIRGFRRFSFRGVLKVAAEWVLICLTHNLLKLFGARGATQAA